MANPTFKITMENGGVIEGELYPTADIIMYGQASDPISLPLRMVRDSKS